MTHNLYMACIIFIQKIILIKVFNKPVILNRIYQYKLKKKKDLLNFIYIYINCVELKFYINYLTHNITFYNLLIKVN